MHTCTRRWTERLQHTRGHSQNFSTLESSMHSGSHAWTHAFIRPHLASSPPSLSGDRICPLFVLLRRNVGEPGFPEGTWINGLFFAAELGVEPNSHSKEILHPLSKRPSEKEKYRSYSSGWFEVVSAHMHAPARMYSCMWHTQRGSCVVQTDVFFHVSDHKKLCETNGSRRELSPRWQEMKMKCQNAATSPQQLRQILGGTVCRPRSGWKKRRTRSSSFLQKETLAEPA